jgi:hypothetical protein
MLQASLMLSHVVWNEGNQRFGVICCFHFQYWHAEHADSSIALHVCSLCTQLHGLTSQQPVTLIFTEVITTNLIYYTHLSPPIYLRRRSRHQLFPLNSHSAPYFSRALAIARHITALIQPPLRMEEKISDDKEVIN